MFEIYTTVSEIHDNVDVVLGDRNLIKLEGKMSMRDLTFKFLNGAVPFFPVHKEIINP